MFLTGMNRFGNDIGCYLRRKFQSNFLKFSAIRTCNANQIIKIFIPISF